MEFSDFFVRFNPAGVAAEVFLQAPVADWCADLTTSPALTEHLLERLAAAPPIPEDEFFTFQAISYLVDLVRMAGPISWWPAEIWLRAEQPPSHALGVLDCGGEFVAADSGGL